MVSSNMGLRLHSGFGLISGASEGGLRGSASEGSVEELLGEEEDESDVEPVSWELVLLLLVRREGMSM